MFGIVLISLVTSSCSVIQSSVEYTKGTECLQRGEYSTAVVHLEKAVSLDPKLSRNHNNLAAAYLGIQDIEKGWYHSRQAVLLDMNNREAISSFKQLSREIFERYDIKIGMSVDKVVSLLGKPDHTIDSNTEMIYFYGTIGLKFADGELKFIIDVLK
jgi:tetratricopeptide (TPR) repeat protein